MPEFIIAPAQDIRALIRQTPTEFQAFDLMLQFVERCIEDGKDPQTFRNAAIFLACRCSVNGKSMAPAAPGGRSMPSLNYLNPWIF
jgi:hypothetical protein